MAAKLLKSLIASMAATGALLIAGCAKEEPYQTEGPKATDNPSVGAPVSAGSQPGEPNAPGTGKGAPPPQDGRRGAR